MRKWLVRLGLGFGAILALLLVLALVVPLFIDWNRYKDRIIDTTRDATGIAPVIAGDISVSLLPGLAVTVRDVSLPNAPGSDEPLMASVQELSLRLSWLPLLRGAVDVSGIDLVRPEILVEQRADGSLNWPPSRTGRPSDATAGTPAGTPPPATAPENGASSPLPDIGIKALRLKNGTVRYVNRADGTTHTLENINLKASLWLVSAPSSLDGTLSWNGLPLNIRASVERIAGGPPGAIRVQLGTGAEKELFVLDGTLSGTGADLALSGTATLSARQAGQTVRDLCAALNVPPPALPRGLEGPVRLSASLKENAQTTVLDPLQLTLGETRLEGTGSLRSGDVPTVTLDLDGPYVDLDSLLAFPETAPHPAASRKAPSPDTGANGEAGTDSAGHTPFMLPTGLDVTLRLGATEAIYKARPIRTIRIEGHLAQNGTLDLPVLSADLPGATGLRARGQVTNTRDGATLALGIGAASGDLRTFLGWLGVDLPSIPADRLRTLRLQTRVSGTPANIQILDTTLAIDDLNVTGAAGFRPGPRPALSLRLALDSLDADAWLPGRTPPGTAPAPGGEKAAQKTSGTAPMLAGLEILNNLDARLDLSIGTLKALDSSFSGVALRGTLSRGLLTLEKSSGYTRGIGGTGLSLSGGLRGFGADPVFEGTEIALTAPGAAALFDVARRFDSTLQTPDGLPEGPVSVGATLKGDLSRLGIGARLGIGDIRLGVGGTWEKVPGTLTSTHDLDVDLEAPDFTRAVRLLGSAYTPEGPLGAVKATSKVRVQMTAQGTPGRVELPDLKLVIGNNALNAALAVDLAGKHPDITGNIAIGALNVDAFLPRGSTGAEGSGNAPAPEKKQAGEERWSTSPLGLDAALGMINADIGLKARALTVAGMTLNDLDTRLTLRDANLDIPSLKGGFHGGTIDGALSLKTRPATAFALNTRVANVVLSRFLQEGSDGGGEMGGQLNIMAAGESLRALVNSLDGSGRLDLGQLDGTTGKTSGKGVLNALLQLVRALNRLGPDGNPASLASTFTIAKGIVSLDPPGTLKSPLYSGTLGGTIDLPRWTLDTSGDFTLSETLLGHLARKLPVKLPRTLKVGVSGSLDRPDISLGSLSLGGGGSLEDAVKAGVQDRFGERLEEKADKVLPGAGGLVQQLLGGKDRHKAGGTPEENTPDPAPDGTPDPDARPDPEKPAGRPGLEDAVRGLLRGPGR